MLGREVKRVDMDFDWYENTKDKNGRAKTWFGYILNSFVECELCVHRGHRIDCPLCMGEYFIRVRIEPPSGEGWQMWEDTSEGSPISPVFRTPEELAQWLEDNNASAMGRHTATKEEWLKMIGQGSAPSGVMANGELMSGVEATKRMERDKEENRRIDLNEISEVKKYAKKNFRDRL